MRALLAGGFSEVYLVRELKTRTLLTLKRMRIDNDNDGMLALATAEVELMVRSYGHSTPCFRPHAPLTLLQKSLPRSAYLVEYVGSEIRPDDTDSRFTVVSILMQYCAGQVQPSPSS